MVLSLLILDEFRYMIICNFNRELYRQIKILCKYVLFGFHQSEQIQLGVNNFQTSLQISDAFFVLHDRII